MYSNYKRPRFTEESDDENEEDKPQIGSAAKIVCTSTKSAENLISALPTVPSRKRRRFTEESDDEDPLSPSPNESIGPFKTKPQLQPPKGAPPKSILKKPSVPFTRPLRSGPPIDAEFRKVFISNIDVARPVEEVKSTILMLMKTQGIPCEQKVDVLPPNIGGRHHRGVAWITLDHQDDIVKAINGVNRTLFGSRIMQAKVHKNPMLSGLTAKANSSCSVSTFSVRRDGYAPPLLPSMIPEWQRKPTTLPTASWGMKDSKDGKKIFIWNIDNNKTPAETESFIFQKLAAEFGSSVVDSVSTYCKGLKVYAFVKFTRSDFAYRALEVIDGLKFGSKHLGAQLSRQRKSKDLDFNPW